MRAAVKLKVVHAPSWAFAVVGEWKQARGKEIMQIRGTQSRLQGKIVGKLGFDTGLSCYKQRLFPCFKTYEGGDTIFSWQKNCTKLILETCNTY